MPNNSQDLSRAMSRRRNHENDNQQNINLTHLTENCGQIFLILSAISTIGSIIYYFFDNSNEIKDNFQPQYNRSLNNLNSSNIANDNSLKSRLYSVLIFNLAIFGTGIFFKLVNKFLKHHQHSHDNSNNLVRLSLVNLQILNRNNFDYWHHDIRRDYINESSDYDEQEEVELNPLYPTLFRNHDQENDIYTDSVNPQTLYQQDLIEQNPITSPNATSLEQAQDLSRRAF